MSLALSGSILSCNIPRVRPVTGEGKSTAVPLPSAEVPATLEVLETPTVRPETAAPQATFDGDPASGRIVFTCSMDGFDQICLMDANGGDLTRLTTQAATDFYASIAPDGTEIVFSSIRVGSFQIYSMDMDGSNQHRLSNGQGSLYAPEVSPDGTQIVFTVETGNTQDIWVMERDGSDAHAAFELGAAALVLPQFAGPDELRKVVGQGTIQGRLSPFWVHFASYYARLRKKVV